MNMKIAFVGKGGSGKTTLSSLFIRYLAAQRIPVTAVDADINQHLGAALGLDDDEAAAIPRSAGGCRSSRTICAGTIRASPPPRP